MSDHPPISNRFIVTGAEVVSDGARQLTVTLVATGPFDYSEMIPLLNGREVALMPAAWLTVNRPAADGGDTVGEEEG